MELHSNPYFAVLLNNNYYEIKFPNHHTIILPILNNAEIVMIKAIRPILGKEIIEFPAGNINKNETYEDCAIRELKEETGIIIQDKNRLIKLQEINPMPARTTTLSKPYFINLKASEFLSRKQHDKEVTEVFVASIPKIIKMIHSGKLFIGNHIAAFFSYLIHEKKILYKNNNIK